MPELDGDPAPRSPRSSAELFTAFNRLALQGFGGVLPVAHRELVERRQWLTAQQFVEVLALGQVLPGPNIVNMALIMGDRHFGWRGALAASAGLLLVPMAIVLALATLYLQFAALPGVAGALRGMGAVAAGLVLATAIKLFGTLAKSPLGRSLGALFAALTFAGVGALRWPMVWVV
ncbi:MAG: chromate transporter, partial [Burkholderiales bacterium]|nr:chromate transporter [Burkholderiales bacterium]